MATKRDQKLAKACLERDGHTCMKCRSTEDLQAHHINALVYGGEDELDNLITLCTECHAEWHCLDLFETSVILFHDWLSIPPWRNILLAMPHAPHDMTWGRFLALVGRALREFRSMN